MIHEFTCSLRCLWTPQIKTPGAFVVVGRGVRRMRAADTRRARPASLLVLAGYSQCSVPGLFSAVLFACLCFALACPPVLQRAAEATACNRG